MFKYLAHGTNYALRVILRNIRLLVLIIATTTFFIIPVPKRVYFFPLLGLGLIIFILDYNRQRKLLSYKNPSVIDWFIIGGNNLYILGMVNLAGGYHSPYFPLSIIPTLLFTIEFGLAAGVINLGFLFLAILINNPFKAGINLVQDLILLLLAGIIVIIQKTQTKIGNRYNQRIIRLLILDELTGLVNRRYLKNQVLKEIRQHKPFSVIMLDIDYFKYYNDHWGHPMGDSLLIHIGRLLKQAVSANDVVARLSGDEFAIFMPLAFQEEIDQTISHIKNLVEEHHFHGEECFPQKKLSLSFGAVNFPEHVSRYEDLMRAVDQRLYQSKKERF